MRLKSKKRFAIFMFMLMIVSAALGYLIGWISFAEDCEEPNTPPEEIESVEAIELGAYTITAYCGCEKCCGQWSSDPVVGAGGVELVEGVHCASPLPLGTTVEIEGLGTYEVQDTTSQWVAEKYDNKIIDIYFTEHQDALNFGKKVLTVKEVIN